MENLNDDENNLQFAERLKRRRRELRYSREDLLAIIRGQRVSGIQAGEVSLSTLKNMENTDDRYRLPLKKSAKNRPMPIELVANALGVPLGYLLAGFESAELSQSFYGPAIEAGIIELRSALRLQLDIDKSLRKFISQLPSTEDDLFNLPLYSFSNQFALSVIFRIERLFAGCEMLLVNEPPFILWDDDDIDAWIYSMENISPEDGRVFAGEFRSYRKYFRELIRSGKKTYKVVVNGPTLQRFLLRKSQMSLRAWLDAAEGLLRHSNFNMVLLEPSDRHPSDSGMHECEVLCKTQVVPLSLEGTVACQILQTPPHQFPTSYFISPAPRQTVMVQREIARVDAAWAEALAQYILECGVDPSAGSLTDTEVRGHTVSRLRCACGVVQSLE